MLGALLDPVISFALPPRCAGCGSITGSDHRFCADCWRSLQFLGPPWCAACHIPFDHDHGQDARCGSCLADPPPHAGVDAAVAYDAIARHVVLRLKYGGRAAFAQTVARLMVRHLRPGADLLLPVPLHRWRLWSRGYNQAALMAAALSQVSGVAWTGNVLARHRATPVLRGLGPTGRRRAVRGAFVVPPDRREAVRGRHVVIVDDVYTSGATTDACITALRSAGAGSVSVLCWARVIERQSD